MTHPADVIQQLMATNSRLDKESVVQAAWDAGCTEFFVGARMALDTLVTFGVQRVPQIEDDAVVGSFAWADFAALAHKLSTRALTGHAARDALISAAEQATAREWNLWYRRLLLKDLKCGTSETTINKVLAKNGASARAYMVPVFSCQLAKSSDDHPKKMRGHKLVDRKWDGVRSLVVIDKQTLTVSMFTRNGLCNTNFDHICTMLEGLLPVLTDSVVLDGEIISTNFQALMTQVNRKSSVDTSDSKLMLFDIIPLKSFREGEYKVSQQDRHTALCELMPHLSALTNGTVEVEPKLSINLDTEQGQQALREFNREALDAGLEGIMIKDPLASYKTRRSDAWLKAKPFISLDLTAVAVKQGKADTEWSHTMGAVLFEGEDQGRKVSVSVGTGYSEQLRDEIWANRDRIIGWIGEIHGDCLTKDRSDDDVWSVRFPAFNRWRGHTVGEKI